MSTIYTDAAGNKYLGDCRWGNHDINYPSTDYLISRNTDGSLSSSASFWSDLSDVCTSAGYNNVAFSSTQPVWPRANTGLGFRLAFDGLDGTDTKNTVGMYTTASTNSTTCAPRLGLGSMANAPGDGVLGYNAGTFLESSRDLIFTFTPESLYIVQFIPSANKTTYTAYTFFSCILEDLNTNFNYYNTPPIRSLIVGGLSGFATIANPGAQTGPRIHHTVNDGASSKMILFGGSSRADYAIDCSDSQTPGAQWATDMWVYDNNPTLGDPVIGRVPNMLLGIGSYTYLKPVKIQGSVFPDGGSPWYLPVGVFAGKTLLMRCHSSMA